MDKIIDRAFWKGKRVFVTGQTGFKGSWMCHILKGFGAQVTGYGLLPTDGINLFNLACVKDGMNSVFGDIRDIASLRRVFDAAQPEIVIHLAAQPIVRESYIEPRYTYETNVMGTVNILECVRENKYVKSFVNVTTDKVYQNKEWVWGYREDEALDGFDPYSNSKSCSELVAHCYASSLFPDHAVGISTARAGNAIGGGDFAKDRIIPDCVRAMRDRKIIIVRNPASTRPYQHVLEPVMAYLMIAERQYEDRRLSGWYNVGPDDCDCVTTGQLVETFCAKWRGNAKWETREARDSPHEAYYLKLDSTKLKTTFGWLPRWHIDEAVDRTVSWTKSWMAEESVSVLMDTQISDYLFSP
jgi:CDP-glucose 4,6-dehydratase